MPGRISRGRGYSWEHYLDLQVNAFPQWYCRRLGGSSANMPDLLCVNNLEARIIAVECKSLMSKKQGKVSLYVPLDQIQRCIKMVEVFALYNREVVLSFKFGRGFKCSFHFTVDWTLWSDILNVDTCITSCDNEGNCFMRFNSETRFKLPRRESMLYGSQLPN